MKNLRSLSLILLLITNIIPGARAQNWPGWRGPSGDGTSTETGLPVKWDSVTNVVWKTPVPGNGYSSPVIWENRLFLTTAFNESQDKSLLCYDTGSGQLLWQQTVVKGPFEAKHRDNSYASGTPVTDGSLVYVSFLDDKDVVVAAYDFAGNQIWLARPGTFISPHGYSCSPILYKDMVIINGNSPRGESFAAALSRKDGKTVWKVLHDENPAHSFSTPIIREMAGKTQMIFGGNQQISSYNPDDGSRYWFVEGPSTDFCSSPVYDEESGLVLMSSAWPRRILVAIKPDGSGNVTESHVVWESTSGAVYVPSPLIAGGYLFTTMTNGLVHCIEPATGNIMWTENLGSQYSSPVLADGLIYIPNDDGVITVIKPGPEFQHISKNDLGEGMFASPAISNGKIYLRGFEHLYCISTDGMLGVN